MKQIPVGVRHSEVAVPGAEHLASAVGNRGVHVVSSPSTILYIEMTCHRALEKYFDAGEATVGVYFGLEHCGAALPGTQIEIEVVVAECDGRTITFNGSVVQGKKVIMRGQHKRAIVDLNRLLKRSATPEKAVWQYWFDPAQPWSWLTARRLQRLAKKYDAQIQWQPVDCNDMSLTSASETVNQSWQQQDLQDYAELERISLSTQPLPESLAQTARQICAHAGEGGQGQRVVPAVLEALWSERRNRDLVQIAVDCGLDADALNAVIESNQCTTQLQESANGAAQAGVVQLPAVESATRTYHGYHRLDLLEAHTVASFC